MVCKNGDNTQPVAADSRSEAEAALHHPAYRPHRRARYIQQSSTDNGTIAAYFWDLRRRAAERIGQSDIRLRSSRRLSRDARRLG